MELWRAFWTFIRLGALTWGGGYAMLPGIQHECVTVHGWVSPEDFSDYLAIAQSAPGPVAGNIALLVGRHLAGWPGGLTCLLGVSIPSFLITLLMGFSLLGGGLPAWARDMLYILQPAIAGLVLATAWYLATNLERSFPVILIAMVALLGLLFKLHPVFLLLFGGVMLVLWRQKWSTGHVD